MQPLNVAFRTDGGKRIGMGHVNRCLSIANYLVGKGIGCIFILSEPSPTSVVSTFGPVHIVKSGPTEATAIKRILRNSSCSILVIDSKRFVGRMIRAAEAAKVKKVLVDNLSFSSKVDLVILPGVKEQFKVIPRNAIVGPEHVLLNPNFHSRKRFPRKRSILLSMGGTDKYNITKKAVAAFANVKSDFTVTVVLGKFYQHEDIMRKQILYDRRFTVVKDPKNFSMLMNTHEVGILAFGITIYEAAAARLPAFVIAHSDENDESARNVEKYGWIRYLGKYDRLNYCKAAEYVISSLNNKEMLKGMSAAAKVVDGKGAERIGRAILNL